MGKSQDFAYKWKRREIDIAHRKKVIRIRFPFSQKTKAKQPSSPFHSLVSLAHSISMRAIGFFFLKMKLTN